MKVMCIQESKKRFNIKTGKELPVNGLVIGGIYTVVGEEFITSLNMSLYELDEFKSTPKLQLFAKYLFSPLSDINECELVNTKEEYA